MLGYYRYLNLKYTGGAGEKGSESELIETKYTGSTISKILTAFNTEKDKKTTTTVVIKVK